METKLQRYYGRSQCILVSASSFFVFTLAKKIWRKPCFPIWKGRAAFSKQIAGGYFPAGIRPKLTRRLSGRCGSWDFIQRADYHAPADFPVKLVFFADGELYEVACVEDGQEALVCHSLRGNKGGSRRIIVVDSPAQIAKIDCPGISGFCTVSQDGQTYSFQESREAHDLDRKLISAE